MRLRFLLLTKGRHDEPHEQKAIQAGMDKVDKLKMDKNLKKWREKAYQFYKEEYNDYKKWTRWKSYKPTDYWDLSRRVGNIMALNKLLSLVALSAILFACGQNDKQIEAKKIAEFSSFKSNMVKTVSLVRNKYYSLGTTNGYNRLQFDLSKDSYRRRNIFSDSAVTNLIGSSKIVDLSFEKSSKCLDKFQYDMVKFRLDDSGLQYKYYYVYEFCSLKQYEVIINTSNFKSIPLGDNWYLEIEKD